MVNVNPLATSTSINAAYLMLADRESERKTERDNTERTSHEEAERKYAEDRPSRPPSTSFLNERLRPIYDDPSDQQNATPPSRQTPHRSPQEHDRLFTSIQIHEDPQPRSQPLQTPRSRPSRSTSPSPSPSLSSSSSGPISTELQMRISLDKAQEAAKEGNSHALHEYDVALAAYFYKEYYPYPSSFYLFSLNYGYRVNATSILLRAMTIPLPNTTNTLYFQLFGGKNEIKFINDLPANQQTQIFTEKITEELLNQMRKDAAMDPSGQDFDNQDIILEDLAIRLSQLPDRKEALANTDPSKQFVFFLYLLLHPKLEVLIPDLFYFLVDSACEDTLPPKQCQDLLTLSRWHPKVSPLSKKGSDGIFLQVLDPLTKTKENIKTSRLLLKTCTEYFENIVKKEALKDLAKGQEDFPKLDLTETKFDRGIIESLLDWLDNENATRFLKPHKTEESSFQELEKILTSFNALGIKNPRILHQQLEDSLFPLINKDLLVDMIALAKRYKLTGVLTACVVYINYNFSSYVSIDFLEENTWMISKKNDEWDECPPFLRKAVDLLEIQAAEIAVKGRDRGCCRNPISDIRFLWNSRFGDFLRSAALWSTIFSLVQKNVTDWTAAQSWTGGVSGMGAQLFLPIIAHKILKRFHQEHLLDIIPKAKIQCKSRISSKISECWDLSVCSKKNLKPASYNEHSPLISAPQPNQRPPVPVNPLSVHLDLSDAVHLTNESFRELLAHHSQIQQLTLSERISLTQEGYSAIGSLDRLRQLNISIETGQEEGPLKALNLTEILSRRPEIKIVITLSDTTLVHSTVTFIRTLPNTHQVVVKLKRDKNEMDDVINNLDDYLSKESYVRYCPGALDRLIKNCSWITHLDCSEGGIFLHHYVDKEIEQLSLKYPGLESLKMRINGSRLQDILQQLSSVFRQCPQLHELDLSCEASDLSGEQIAFSLLNSLAKESKLTDLVLRFFSFTNESLALLAQISTLRYCALDSPTGNFDDRGIDHLLNRQPPFENLVVRSRLQNENFSRLSWGKIQKLAQLAARGWTAGQIHFCKTSTIPRLHHFAFREYAQPLLPLFFQFFGDNFHQFQEPLKTYLETRTFLEESKLLRLFKNCLTHLKIPIPSETALQIRVSMLNSIAKMHLNPLLGRIYLHKNEIRYENFHNEYSQEPDPFLLNEFWMGLLIKWMEKSIQSYWEFLQKTQSKEFYIQVTTLAMRVSADSQRDFGMFREGLQMIFPRARLGRRSLFKLFENYFKTRDGLHLVTLVKGWARAVGNEGERCGWTTPQKNLAFLGTIFANLSWIQELLTTHD